MQAPTAALDATASPGPHAVRSDANRLLEFFRYHGVWAPGVRLFRSVGFQAKAWIIALTFMLPIAQLSWNYLSEQSARLGFSAQERAGIEVVRELGPLLQALQRQRLLAARGTPAEQAEVRSAIESRLARLAALDKAWGATLGTAKAYAAVKAGADGPTVMNLLLAVADGSKLTLDPDIDSYYLRDAAIFRLPVMIEAAGQLGALGASVLEGKQGTPAQTRRIVEQVMLLSSHEAGVATAIDKAAAANHSVDEAVKDDEVRAPVREFAAEIERSLLRVEGPQGDAAGHLAAALRCVDGLSALMVQVTDKLDALIEERMARLVAARNLSFLVLALGLLTALYLFMAFRKVLDGGLKEVAFHIDAMRNGDLTTQPRAWGADEAARLMHTLSQMQLSLRRIVSQVRGASDSIVSASAQIAAGAKDLSERTEQSAANLEETAAAMEEIAATVRRGEDTVAEATRLAATNADAAERGGRIVGEVVQTMQDINASSGRIGDIIGTIDGIAFQTNILALNAAVEAARAGEQGRGFAVVAAEVRALAQRSAAAAREIKGLITTSVQQADNGVRVVRDAGQTINEIVASAQHMRGLLAEVAVGAREQTAGVAQSAQAVHELDNVTQQNAALVEETAAAADTLQGQAQDLAAEVARFRLPAA